VRKNSQVEVVTYLSNKTITNFTNCTYQFSMLRNFFRRSTIHKPTCK